MKEKSFVGMHNRIAEGVKAVNEFVKFLGKLHAITGDKKWCEHAVEIADIASELVDVFLVAENEFINDCDEIDKAVDAIEKHTMN